MVAKVIDSLNQIGAESFSNQFRGFSSVISLLVNKNRGDLFP
jgi:hypothetical protein